MSEQNDVTPEPEITEEEAPEVVAHSDDEGEETPWCIGHQEKIS
ncbi:hypothetical protein ACQP1K_17880 [Sphaerimonospora sp. CA-214678]